MQIFEFYRWKARRRHWKALFRNAKGIWMEIWFCLRFYLKTLSPRWRRRVSIIPKYIIHIIMDTQALYFMGAPHSKHPSTSSHNIFVQLTYYICLCFMSFNGTLMGRWKERRMKNVKSFRCRMMWMSVWHCQKYSRTYLS